MEAEFHFCCEIDKYCKCGKYCNGKRKHTYIESFENCSPTLLDILENVDSSKYYPDHPQYSYKSPYSNNFPMWELLLKGMAKENLEILIPYVIKQGITPDQIYFDESHTWDRILNKFKKLMEISIKNMDYDLKTYFPNQMLKKLNTADYSVLMNYSLHGFSEIEYDIDDTKPHIAFPKERHLNSCNFCGDCTNCLSYSTYIWKISSSLKEFPHIWFSEKYINLLSATSDLIYQEIVSEIENLNKDHLFWVRSLPGKRNQLFKEISIDNISDYKSNIKDYIKVIIGVVNYKSYIKDASKKTRIGKQVVLDSMFDWMESCRYLPLGEVMPEWNSISGHHSTDSNFDINVLEKIILTLGGRIFGFSIIIEEILLANNDPLLPLWKEMNVCLQIDKFFAAQSIVATLFGLIRDTRCVEEIKSISSNLDRDNFTKAFGDLVNNFGEDALSSCVLLVPFVHSDKILASERSTSLNRNGTVHKGIEYFSKFNLFGMLLSLCYLFKEMYRYDPISINEMPNQIFKPKNQW